MLILMGYKMLIVSQSNKGVDALFKSVIEVLMAEGLDDELDKCVRMRSEALEKGLAQHLEADMPATDSRFAAANYWMAACCARFAADNQDKPLVRE